TVVNVKTNDLSYFSVFVSDDISSAESVTVWLYPWVTPRFIDAPVSQYVVVGTSHAQRPDHWLAAALYLYLAARRGWPRHKRPGRNGFVLHFHGRDQR